MRRALTVTTVLALTSAGLMVADTPAALATEPVTVTFSYNGTTGADGTAQIWVAPADVHWATFELWGASGADFTDSAGGHGAVVKGTFPVEPNVDYLVNVGGMPSGELVGGFNGGGVGAGGDAKASSGGGGGASDIRTDSSPQDRLLVAGGGGGGGAQGMASFPGVGGAGGDGGDAGADGEAGASVSALGIPVQGGAPGRAGCSNVDSPEPGCSQGGFPGTESGVGGQGSVSLAGGVGLGGAGGGGFFGGGGGSTGQVAGGSEPGDPAWRAGGGGGGGGSSYVRVDAKNASISTRGTHGHGRVTITFLVGDIDGDSLVETDRCPTVYGAGAEGCPTRTTALSLSYRPSTHTFRGRITSSAAGCVANRVVTLVQVRKGPDRLFKTTKSGPGGRYSMRFRAEVGKRYYTSILRELVPSAGFCVKATSNVVRPRR